MLNIIMCKNWFCINSKDVHYDDFMDLINENGFSKMIDVRSYNVEDGRWFIDTVLESDNEMGHARLYGLLHILSNNFTLTIN